jgi:hypothetical protein
MPADQRGSKRRATGAPDTNLENVQLLQDAVQSLTELCVEVREDGDHLHRQARRDSKNVSEMLGNHQAQENRMMNMAAQLNKTSIQQRGQEGRLTWVSTAGIEDRRDIVYLQNTVVALQAQVHQLQIRASECSCDTLVQEAVMSYTPVCFEKYRPRSDTQRVAAIAQSVEACLRSCMQGNHVESEEEEDELEAQAEADLEAQAEAAQGEDQVQDQEQE